VHDTQPVTPLGKTANFGATGEITATYLGHDAYVRQILGRRQPIDPVSHRTVSATDRTPYGVSRRITSFSFQKLINYN